MTPTSISRNVTLGGFAGNLSVSDGGNGSAAPVLFVHTFAGSAKQWQPQLDHLRSTRIAGLIVEGTGGKMCDTMPKPTLEALDAHFEQQMPEYW